MRRTLADVRSDDNRIAAAWNMCSTDTRITAIVNEVQERLLPFNPWGSFARFRCQASDGLIVLPNEVAAVWAWATSNVPMKARDMAFEFVETTQGIQSSTNPSRQALDRGNTPVFRQITGITNNVKVYNDLTDDNNTPVLLLGYDENGNWIRKRQAGVWKDGILVLSSTVGVIALNDAGNPQIFSTITGVQLSRRNGPVRLYSVDSITAATEFLAVYQYHETKPNYRVFYIPELDIVASTTNPITIDCVVKMELVPVVEDTDYLLVSCLPAIKDMGSAIIAAENEPVQENKAKSIAAGLALARADLEAELRHYVGAPQGVAQVQDSSGPTGEPIEQLV